MQIIFGEFFFFFSPILRVSGIALKQCDTRFKGTFPGGIINNFYGRNIFGMESELYASEKWGGKEIRKF